jgi:hypothetical protein
VIRTLRDPVRDPPGRKEAASAALGATSFENYFSKIKEFRGVNTRYDKTDTSYQATWNIAATVHSITINVHRP